MAENGWSKMLQKVKKSCKNGNISEAYTWELKGNVILMETYCLKLTKILSGKNQRRKSDLQCS